MHYFDLLGMIAIAGTFLAIVGLCIGFASVVWRTKHSTPQCTPSRGEVLARRPAAAVDDVRMSDSDMERLYNRLVIAQLERQFDDT